MYTQIFDSSVHYCSKVEGLPFMYTNITDRMIPGTLYLDGTGFGGSESDLSHTNLLWLCHLTAPSKIVFDLPVSQTLKTSVEKIPFKGLCK